MYFMKMMSRESKSYFDENFQNDEFDGPVIASIPRIL